MRCRKPEFKLFIALLSCCDSDVEIDDDHYYLIGVVQQSFGGSDVCMTGSEVKSIQNFKVLTVVFLTKLYRFNRSLTVYMSVLNELSIKTETYFSSAIGTYFKMNTIQKTENRCILF